MCVSAGRDGTVRCYHLKSGDLLQRTWLKASVACLVPWPQQLDRHGRAYLTGTEEGSVYVLWRTLEGFKVHQACKPHKVGTRLVWLRTGVVLA